jgi:hypothetical protein
MNAQSTKKRKLVQEEPDFKQFDYVKVKVSRPELGIKKGDKGAIVDVYNEDVYNGLPKAYEVDVSNELDTFLAHELALVEPEKPAKKLKEHTKANYETPPPSLDEKDKDGLP